MVKVKIPKPALEDLIKLVSFKFDDGNWEEIGITDGINGDPDVVIEGNQIKYNVFNKIHQANWGYPGYLEFAISEWIFFQSLVNEEFNKKLEELERLRLLVDDYQLINYSIHAAIGSDN